MCPRTGMLRSTLERSSERAPTPDGPEPAAQVDAGRDEPNVRLSGRAWPGDPGLTERAEMLADSRLRRPKRRLSHRRRASDD